MAQSWLRTDAPDRPATTSATADFPVPCAPVTTNSVGTPAMGWRPYSCAHHPVRIGQAPGSDGQVSSRIGQVSSSDRTGPEPMLPPNGPRRR